MSDIGAVVPADTRLPLEEHRRVERDGRKPPRQPRKPQAGDDNMVESEPHKLDLEA